MGMAHPGADRDPAPPVPAARYSLCAQSAAEARVAQDLSRLATGIDSEVGDAMRALLLTGPFARGEGSIVELDGEPYAADPGYELLVLLKRRPERRARSLSTMAATWARLLRTKVAIRPFATHDLPHVPPTRFWFHASKGQVVTLAGDPSLAQTIPDLSATGLRWDEPTFTLCEGLVALALATLDAGVAWTTQVERMQRAVLACGDALLLRRDQYAETLRARAEALRAAHAGAALCAGHAEARRWSIRPDLWSPEGGDLEAWLESTRRWLATCYLDFEAEHTGTPRDLLGYVDHGRPLLAEPKGTRRLSVALATRALSRKLPLVSSWGMAPLELLLRCSVALAFAPRDPACRRAAARLLGLPGAARAARSNGELADGLHALATRALSDPIGHPFVAFADAQSSA
jgi:hypothetical protein